MHHVVVHAHCYQPPREDPWLEVVESEPSAAPDHDWNARITRECYARLGAAEIRVRDPRASPTDPDARAGLARLVNLYGWCTFDVGATLCEWMDAHAPDVLRAMVAGDAASVKRWGHGNAIAAPYHHVILPLASPRDRRTEVRWGIADFQRRFGRAPEGMWLPECAADEDTLDLLAREGILFTILAPYQIDAGGETHGLPVRWRGTSGRSLVILPYDGPLAGEVAFGGLLSDAGALARRLAPTMADGQHRCTTLATDGETFGHHHRNGERTLARAMALIGESHHAQLTNAATLVARTPPVREARLHSPSSWSCAHGVERWRSNCGCRIDMSKPPAQEWRGPLRTAMVSLAERTASVFASEGASLFARDPSDVRDDYGTVVAMDGEALEQFTRANVQAGVGDAGVQRARELLEMQRASLRTFTSCAWFFDDVNRIEIRQVLRYACRAMALALVPDSVQESFVSDLRLAHATAPRSESAADVYQSTVVPVRATEWNVAAGAIALASAHLPFAHVGVFDVEGHAIDSQWRVVLTHRRTGAIDTFVGAVTDASIASFTVSLSRSTTHQALTSASIAIAELPEAVGAALLSLHTLDDAILGSHAS